MKTENNTLLPCPFCGEMDIVINESDEYWWFVECCACTAGFDGITTKKAATELWNTRYEN